MDRIADSKLLARARSGDRGAFGALIKRHQPMVRRVAGGVVGHNETALELANESMLQAYLSLDRLRDDSRFQSWLYGIVLNVCKGHLRDQTRAPLSLEEVMGGVRFEAIPFAGIEPEPHEVAEARELHRLVLNAVNSLSPRIRAAALLFYYDQLSVREVAGARDFRSRTRGSESVLRRFKERVFEGQQRAKQADPEERKETNEKERQELLAAIFGSESEDPGEAAGAK